METTPLVKVNCKDLAQKLFCEQFSPSKRTTPQTRTYSQNPDPVHRQSKPYSPKSRNGDSLSPFLTLDRANRPGEPHIGRANRPGEPPGPLTSPGCAFLASPLFPLKLLRPRNHLKQNLLHNFNFLQRRFPA